MRQEDVKQEDYVARVGTINAALAAYDFEIRSMKPQKTTRQRSSSAAADSVADAPVYALVNTTPDAFSQLATSFSADELAFIRRVLDSIFITNNTARRELCAVPGVQAVRLHRATTSSSSAGADGDRAGVDSSTVDAAETAPAPVQSIALVQAERVLARLVDDGWLLRSKAGYYSLAPRGLLELRTWLVDEYNDEEDGEDEEDEEHVQDRAGTDHGRRRWQRIRFCDACAEIVTVVGEHLALLKICRAAAKLTGWYDM